MTCQSLTRISQRTSLPPRLQTFNHFFTILGSCTLTSSPSPASGLSSPVLCDIRAALHAALPRRNATNCDNNPNQMLKYYCKDLSPVITHLFNGSFTQSSVSAIQKMANIIIIPSGAYLSTLKDYCPILLISKVAKVMKQTLFSGKIKRLYSQNFSLRRLGTFTYLQAISNTTIIRQTSSKGQRGNKILRE